MKFYHLVFSAFLLPFMVIANKPQGIVEGNNNFAFNLFTELKKNQDANLFCSPFSISTAVAMTYAGARNETAIQMSRTMNFQPGETFHAEYKKLLDRLDESADGKIRLNIANGLWAQQDLKFLGIYFDLVKSNYRSDLRNVDFKDDIKREETRKEINAWVEKETNDKIKNLLSPDDLDRVTRLVLVNAIYFYGDWAKPFEKERTRSKDFFLSKGSGINVPFMNQQSGFKYYEDSVIKAIELPYKEDKASMMIFLPNTNNGIGEFEKSFDLRYYLDIMASLETKDVRLSLPKFETTCKFKLCSALSRMGMPLAFSKDYADFSGMTGKPELYISDVIHQAFIHVDELGTEAAAATAVTTRCMMARPLDNIKVFNADHPFIFLIKDNATGSILFMGKIMNPSEN